MTPALGTVTIDPIKTDYISKGITPICISGTAYISGTTNIEKETSFDYGCIIAKTTNSGMLMGDNPFQSSPEAIMELYRLIGLTWDQLAKLFGVSRRSLHFWASGKALNAPNEEHLRRVLAVIRRIERGSAGENRSLLLSEMPDGNTPFNMLLAKDYEGVIENLPVNFPLAIRKTAKAAGGASVLNMPLRPQELVGALQDSVHADKGRLISAVPLRKKGKS